jgi:hypothetical protein
MQVEMRPNLQPKSHAYTRGGRMASQGQGSQDMWQCVWFGGGLKA